MRLVKIDPCVKPVDPADGGAKQRHAPHLDLERLTKRRQRGEARLQTDGRNVMDETDRAAVGMHDPADQQDGRMAPTGTPVAVRGPAQICSAPAVTAGFVSLVRPREHAPSPRRHAIGRRDARSARTALSVRDRAIWCLSLICLAAHLISPNGVGEPC
ncbi:hypothetical protein QP174_07105 [Sphingomonas aerolata]